jgi:hypothetical protein
MKTAWLAIMLGVTLYDMVNDFKTSKALLRKMGVKI